MDGIAANDMKAFVIADTHWGHQGVCNFLRSDGTKLRPWENAFQMDKDMIQYWNDTVAPGDRVYILGDWAIKRSAIRIAELLHGKKVLIKGNHDIFKLKDYAPYFDDIRAYKVFRLHSGKQGIMSHIPVHPASLGDRFAINIHGHLHSNVVLDNDAPDPRYVCVSAEHTNFRPLDLNTIINDK